MDRFVHVSDLHFADIDPAKGDPLYPAAARIWPYIPGAAGFWGHSDLALAALQEHVDGVLRDDPNARLIVSGDLTSNGNPAQFVHATNFLAKQLAFKRGDPVGLRIADWVERAIPGNHDHWPGIYWPMGGPTAGLNVCFPFLPDPQNIPSFSLSGGRRLTPIRINTDADVSPGSVFRLFAWGLFESQLTHLDGLLGPRERGEIRVLLLHHSAAHQGVNLIIDPQCKSILNKFLVRHEIRVMLCGHTHVAKLTKATIDDRERTAPEVLEACCGTTTQDDDPPHRIRRLFGVPNAQQFPQNALIMHEVEEGAGGVHWKATIYRRHGTFEPCSLSSSTEEIFIPD